MVDRINRINRIKIGLSKGVFIHFQSQVRFLLSRKAVRAIRVTRWIMHMAQPWTDALASGVKINNAYTA
jgi:hypothetical protein